MNQQFVNSDHLIARDIRLQSFDKVMVELEKLGKAPKILLSPGWNLAHTFDHCARSIEHSMLGFPELKNPVFRAIVGTAVFHVFDMQGYMRHDVTQEIPGDEEPPANLTLDAALTRLKQSIDTFEHWTGELKPHFAYGTLSKSQYERANAMHIANHLAVIEY